MVSAKNRTSQDVSPWGSGAVLALVTAYLPCLHHLHSDGLMAAIGWMDGWIDTWINGDTVGPATKAVNKILTPFFPLFKFHNFCVYIHTHTHTHPTTLFSLQSLKSRFL